MSVGSALSLTDRLENSDEIELGIFGGGGSTTVSSPAQYGETPSFLGIQLPCPGEHHKQVPP